MITDDDFENDPFEKTGPAWTGVPVVELEQRPAGRAFRPSTIW